MQFRWITLACFCTATAACPAQAQVVAQWSFNSTTPDGNTATGAITPSNETGTLTLVGGTTNTFAAGSPGDPAAAADNSGFNSTTYPAQGAGSGTAGVQFAASTFGSPGQVQIALDFRQSGTASRYWQLQASSNGTSFSNVSGGFASVGTINAGNTLTSFDSTGLYVNNPGGGSQTFVQSISYLFPSGSAFENNANFAFRWVAIFDPTGANGSNYISANAGTTAAYATAGTARFDMATISVSPVPEPGSIALVGFAAAGFAARLIRRKKTATTAAA